MEDTETEKIRRAIRFKKIKLDDLPKKKKKMSKLESYINEKFNKEIRKKIAENPQYVALAAIVCFSGFIFCSLFPILSICICTRKIKKLEYKLGGKTPGNIKR